MSRGTILVADDEPAIRTLITNILKVEGYRLIEAVDGLDALQKIRQQDAQIDLLLTDVRMPRMDGMALARRVVEALPGTPVLYISAFPFDLEEERARHEACVFLPKPFTRKVLLDAVRKCLQSPEGAAGAAG